MGIGYVYVLKNNAFGANVLKVGLTGRSPDLRAREIYAGSTGVPLPFQVAEAFSVADGARAEKLVQSRLRVYRLNRRREFFRLQLEVAAAVVGEVCAQVNAEVGAEAPNRFSFSESKSKALADAPNDGVPDESDGMPMYEVPVDRLIEGPIQTACLSEEHRDRADILFKALSRMSPVLREEWLDGFMRDEHPERELRIWEHLALAYLTLDNADEAPEPYRAEAFALLLARTWSSTEEVLSRANLKNFSRASAKRLLDAYGLRPKPLVVRAGRLGL